MTKKLKFYLLLLVAAGVIFYLTPYFYPLIKNQVDPIKEPFNETAREYGLNPGALIILTALIVAFLFVLVVTVLAGKELEKQISIFLNTLKK